jgi:2-polyprenyl-3-methyl-5-hydroxy-6-metoxy-1,4-benzoquinol methylase
VSDVASWEAQGNRHVDLAGDERPRPHHRVIAALAARHAGERGRVLDLGTGLGQIARLVRATRPEVELHVADAYEECLERTARATRVDARWRLEEGRLALGALPRDYDVVVLSHVLEHTLDPVGALAEVLSVVRPGGVVVAAVPNPARPAVLVSNAFRRHYVNRGHVVAWDRSHWINFLEKILGLEVVEYASDLVALFPDRVKTIVPVLERVEVAAARVFPWWASSNIAVIRKR